MNPEKISLILEQAAASVRKAAGLTSALCECVLQIGEDTVNMHRLPEQPLLWVNNMTIELGKQAKALNTVIQQLRPLVDAELTRQFSEDTAAEREALIAAAAEHGPDSEPVPPMGAAKH